MRPSQRITVTASLLLVVCLAGSAALLHRTDQLRAGATLEEVLYVSSPKMLKRMSLGYDGLLADIYWTRAVQYFGKKHHVGAAHYNLLAPLLEITTALDPRLTVAYEFGANFLSPQPPNGAGMPDRAVDLVETGIRANPDEWRLYYSLGFIHYMERKDYAAAAQAFQRGSHAPNAHPWMKLLAAQMAQRGGDLETARMMWTATYETTPDPMIKSNAVAHLRALQADEDVTQLVAAIERFRDRTGHLPVSFNQLVTVGLLPEVPQDPTGQPYRLMPDGRVEVRYPEDLPFIQKGLPPGYDSSVPKVKPEPASK
jgi:hypothetical protein